MWDRTQGAFKDESRAASRVAQNGHDYAVVCDDVNSGSDLENVGAIGFDDLDEAREAADDRPDDYTVRRPRVKPSGVWYFEEVE